MTLEKDIIGTEVWDRTGSEKGVVYRQLPEPPLLDGSRLYLIHWDTGRVSTVWDSELREPRASEVSPLGGWHINKFGKLQVCRQK